MDLKKVSRFEVKEQLGEGSFSKLYKAIDNVRNCEVALKVEKEDKCKKILKLEYEILRNVQSLSNVPRVYEFIEDENFNFIVMELLGKNIASLKKSMGASFTNVFIYDILLQMLTCIENVHSKGYIHRDIKPSNFVICPKEKKVYIIDFGLAKLHLNKLGEPNPERKNADFRGTIAFASMNAHNRLDLGRRDDLWSFFFVILDLLGEVVPWRRCGEEKEVIETHKRECINNPEKLLLSNKVNKKQLFEIFYHIKSLRYSDRPNYEFIRSKLKELLNEEIMIINIQSDQNLMYYFRNSLFPQNNHLGLGPFLELINNQKESTKNSSGGQISPKNDPFVDNLSKSNNNVLNNINKINENEMKSNENNILKRKRVRKSEDEVLKYFKVEKDQFKKNNAKNQIENKSKMKDFPELLLKQLVSSDDKFLSYINNLNFLNNYYLNYYSFDLYVKLNTMTNMMKSQDLNNNYVFSHNPIYDQYLLIQNEQKFP